MVAVIDANVTTLIAAIVLWILGSGTIKGFAMTLVISIGVSLFTALLVTRGILHLFNPLVKNKEKFYHLKREEETNE